MRFHRLVLFLLATLVWTAIANAADLTQIDCTIRKEPAYKSKPKYCLLVFGPEAKTKVWLVLDGDVLYVDRNGNGDLTEKGKRVDAEPKQEVKSSRLVGNSFKVGEILPADGKPMYTDMWVKCARPRLGEDPLFGRDLLAFVNLSSEGGYKYKVGTGRLKFSDQSKDAPIIHFGGPLRMSLWGVYPRPGRVIEIAAGIGTPGLGEDTFAAIKIDVPPSKRHPMAEIEFPSKEKGEKPLKVKLALSKRCCDIDFRNSVQVPEAVGKGKAKITLSFPDWKEGKVASASTTFEWPLAALGKR